MNPWCRPATQEKQERPTLVLLLGCSRDENIALAVGAGCEEEGVPVIWERAEGQADELARQAAQRSRLEVGIGFDAEAGAVTFAKYPSPKAYLKTEVRNLETARWLGQAAACFVKSKPLPEKSRPLPGGTPEQSPSRNEVLQVPSPKAESHRPLCTEEKETSEVVVELITKAVVEALRRQR